MRRLYSSVGPNDPAPPHTPPRFSSSPTLSELGRMVADAAPTQPSTERRVKRAVSAMFYDSLRQQRMRFLSKEAGGGHPSSPEFQHVEFDSASESSSGGGSRDSSSEDGSNASRIDTGIVEVLTTDINAPPPDPLYIE